MATRNPSSREPDLYENPASLENVTQDLHQTEEKLLQLRQQMEEYERRARQLAQLKARREEVMNGQKTMHEKLARALIILESAEHEARRQVEQIGITRQSFTEHVERLSSIAPDQWDPEEFDSNLNESITLIDNAKADYAQSRAKIDALCGSDLEEVADQGEENSANSDLLKGSGFGELFQRGLAFTLPLIIAIIILAVAILARH